MPAQFISTRGVPFALVAASSAAMASASLTTLPPMPRPPISAATF